MKKIFYTGLTGLLLFEIANVYFIMPMPGSQRMNSIQLAYFLYEWRWGFRIFFAALMLYGLIKAAWKWKWTLAFPLLLPGAVIYMVNFKMAADAMFRQPGKITLVPVEANRVDAKRLVIGVVNDGIAKAYPIQFLGYHHFVYDTINGKNILVTYCTVCRTGRVFDPVINGKAEKFRLVGMDHFNAMIEDASTKSWWRQSTGEAVAGKLKGEKLSELQCTQATLAEWIKLYPNTLIMQADKDYLDQYDKTFKYEDGTSTGNLTGTDPGSWNFKSWVIGLKVDGNYKAFDWNVLRQKKILEDKIGGTDVFVVLAADGKSFFAYKNPAPGKIALENDTIRINDKKFALTGVGIDTSLHLQRVKAYQEFWHSWQSFQPATER